MTTIETKRWMRASIKTDKPVMCIDLDGVMCNFDKRYQELITSGVSRNKIWTHPEAYKNLEPIDGAVEAWHLLQPKFETYILSTPPWSSPDAWKEKRIWVQDFLGKSVNKKLILCHNKGIVKGDYLIDDRLANGVMDFEGEHIHFGEIYPTWESVLKYLNVI